MAKYSGKNYDMDYNMDYEGGMKKGMDYKGGKMYRKTYTRPPKNGSYKNMSGKYKGQIGDSTFEADSYNPDYGYPMGPKGLDSLHDDIGEKSGFTSEGYMDKGGTPFGENAKFNFLPPGMDISMQENSEIHEMPLKKVTSESYEGDGWEPYPRDVEE